MTGRIADGESPWVSSAEDASLVVEVARRPGPEGSNTSIVTRRVMAPVSQRGVIVARLRVQRVE